MPVYDHLTYTQSNLNTPRTEITLVVAMVSEFFEMW